MALQRLMPCLLLILLAMPAAAGPPVQVVTDPVGDVNTTVTPTNEDAVDITGITLGSNGSVLDVTFELVDLREDQGPAGYQLLMSLGSTTLVVRCDLGDYGSDEVGGLDETVDEANGEHHVCTAGTRTSEVIWSAVVHVEVPSDTVVDVDFTFNAVDDTLTVHAPYSAFGASSGDSVTGFDAYACDSPALTTCQIVDWATGSGSYTLQ